MHNTYMYLNVFSFVIQIFFGVTQKNILQLSYKTEPLLMLNENEINTNYKCCELKMPTLLFLALSLRSSIINRKIVNKNI